MGRVYTKPLQNQTPEWGWQLGMASVVLVILVLGLSRLQPHVFALFWPSEREQRVSDFVTNIQSNQTLDPSEYWQIRDLYAPGALTHDETTANVLGVLELVQAPMPSMTLLEYQGTDFKSLERVVVVPDPRQASIATVSAELASVGEGLTFEGETVVETPTLRLQKLPAGVIRLTFVKSLDDMRRVNGLFDYTEAELKLLKNVVWLSESEFKISE